MRYVQFYLVQADGTEKFIDYSDTWEDSGVSAREDLKRNVFRLHDEKWAIADDFFEVGITMYVHTDGELVAMMVNPNGDEWSFIVAERRHAMHLIRFMAPVVTAMQSTLHTAQLAELLRRQNGSSDGK